jgi:ATP-binding cassette, subfamily B, bacterial
MLRLFFNKKAHEDETPAVKKRRVQFCQQLETSDCGPACLKMVTSAYGKQIPLEELRVLCKSGRLGTSIYTMQLGAEKIGLESVAAQTDIDALQQDVPMPAVLFWNRNHFVVLERIKEPIKLVRNKIRIRGARYLIADPSFGRVRLNRTDFQKKWMAGADKGVIIFFEPADEFTQRAGHRPASGQPKTTYLRRILLLAKRNTLGLIFILLAMVASSLISLAFPILTQKIVDVGIKFKSRQFLELILIFQAGIFLCNLFLDAVKSRLILFVGAKIEIIITRDFLIKLMRLPLYFFDTKIVGDLMQRIGDNGRIAAFIKSQMLDFLVGVCNLIVLSALIWHYQKSILLIFAVGSIFSIAWSLYFGRRRELLDYRRFDASIENTDNLVETIIAMHEIRLNNATKWKIKRWTNIQTRLFEVNNLMLRLQQLQASGAMSINQLKNIFITFWAANLVISGNLSLGEMIGLSAVIGQLSVPLYQMTNFIQSLQDTRIAFRRLSEIQSKENEDSHLRPVDAEDQAPIPVCLFDRIRIQNMSFSYSESSNDLLFNELSLEIPRGKTTALVGYSGSGKTTLMKILLKFYSPLSGSILLDDHDIVNIHSNDWRRSCGVVMQDGYIFTETVKGNICMNSELIDENRLMEAARISRIDSFVESLPMGYETRIGSGGVGLSAGQKQRILIARAVYKNPEILFLDEATSALDSENEREIHQNLERFFRGKTVFMIAHRLSTVKNAHNIIVLDEGKIVEQGRHKDLVTEKGLYYKLIKNQLELGR